MPDLVGDYKSDALKKLKSKGFNLIRYTNRDIPSTKKLRDVLMGNDAHL